jgi:2-succinyl-5-enolpyruvyl-6-hydroxy-3-cyclohexene-1-carboxylate synthase
VHVNVPFREPTVPLTDDGRTVGQPFTTPLETGAAAGVSRPGLDAAASARRLDDGTVAALATRFAAVERGLLVVGSGAEDHAAADAVHALARATGWPVLAEGHTATRHRDGALQAWPHLVADAGFRAAHRPELVVRVGRATLTRPLAGLVATATDELLVDAWGRWWDPDRTVTELVAADPADTFTRIADALAMPTSSVWGDGWRTADACVTAALVAHVDAGGGQVGARVVRTAIADAPLGAHVFVASSTAIRHLQQHAPAREDLVWHANRGAAGIDGNVSTALGIAIASAASAGAPVVAIVGDLALLHDTNAWLLAAAVDRCDLTIVVLDDDGGTIFDLLPPGAFEAQRRLFATPHGRDLAHLATLHRLGHHAAEPGDVGALVAAAEGAGQRLVHVRLGPPDPAVPAATAAVVAEALTTVGRPGEDDR